jgi:hypothetical protein
MKTNLFPSTVTPGKFVFAPAASPSCRAAGDISIYGELAPGGEEYGARKFVATVPDTVWGSAKANAEFIVLACNAHADLLAALEMLVASLEWEEKRSGITYNGFDSARAAIAKARGHE